MPERYVVVGCAGTGKTSKAMELIEERLRAGLKWYEIGYSSFSRSACEEAAVRASRITGVPVDRLQKEGFFRTVHSAVLRLLGVDPKCILDHESADGKKFMTEALGAPRGGEPGTLGAKIDLALSWWDLERARLTRFGSNSSFSEERSVVNGCQGDKACAGCAGSDGVCAGSFAYPDHAFNQSKHGDSDVCAGYSIPYRGENENQKSDTPRRENQKTLNKSVYSSIFGPYRREKTGKKVCAGSGQYRYTDPVHTAQEFQHNEQVGQFREIVSRYENQKRVWGKLDFSDLLFKYAGVRADENLAFQDAYAEGSVPAEIKLWIVDEFQDCSDILGMCCLRLSEAAEELWMLGDRYQSVYGFSGANWRLMAAFEHEAKESGRRILLNRSWRNPETVVAWGEDVLHTDEDYDSREPVGLNGEGTVGLLEWRDFQSQLPLLATSDTMVLSRTWFNLGRVTQFLDSAGIPWRSIQEKQKSRWESPVQIAFVLVMRELGSGGRISESDWRRVTEELPQKMNGQELFVRGAKAKWKKIECSREPKRTLDELDDWGAAAGFADWVRAERWRIDKALLLDQAIDKFGIDCVREPGLRLGSCHAAKGMEARNVLVLASSTEKASGKDIDFYEDLFLKYVSITRASENYRLVVDSNDLMRGKPMFWAAPKGFREFVPLPQEAFRARKRHSDEDREMGEISTESVGVQVPGNTIQFERGSGSAAGSGTAVPRAGGEEAGRTAHADATQDPAGDSYDWITI